MVSITRGAGSRRSTKARSHDTYGERGFTILCFPCDQFGHQGISGFASELRRHLPMFSKIEVNGDGAHLLYQWLRQEKGGVLGSKIKWNFTKYRQGRLRCSAATRRPPSRRRSPAT